MEIQIELQVQIDLQALDSIKEAKLWNSFLLFNRADTHFGVALFGIKLTKTEMCD